MTLISCYLDQRRVIQVSDTRLTQLDGSVYDDNAVKAIRVSCRDAEFSVAYTGLAVVLSAETIRRIAGETTLIGAMVRVGELEPVNGVYHLRTDTWLESFFESIGAPEKSRHQIASELRDFSTELFRKMRLIQALPLERTGLTIQMSGFERGERFSLVVSNARDEVRHLGNVSDDFTVSRLTNEMSRGQGGRGLLLEGATPAIVGTVDGRIAATRRRIARKTNEEGVAMLVSMVRHAAGHRAYGHLIGKSCLATVINRDGTFQTWSYPEDENGPVLFPHEIGGGASLFGTSMRISREAGESPTSIWRHTIERE